MSKGFSRDQPDPSTPKADSEDHRRPLDANPESTVPDVGAGGIDVATASAPGKSWRDFWVSGEAASFLVSFILHVSLILILSIWYLPIPEVRQLSLVVAHDASHVEADLATTRADLTSPIEGGTRGGELGLAMGPDMSLDLSNPDEIPGSPGMNEVGSSVNESASLSQIVRSTGAIGGGYEGRSSSRRGELALGRGGTPQSENAVGLALAWLATHQSPDGGWRFDLTKAPCGGQCQNSGTIGTTTGATGLALLPFLGAGQTHFDGEYRDTVNRGLYYLKSRIVMTSEGADLQEGSMYGQGIATIALCEAYAMTKDQSLRQAAQRAVDFICAAQHSAGGWRYIPRQPGDTTVFGWQMMALKSASMAGLQVPSPVLSLAERFLDSVQSGGGSYYGYLVPTRSSSPTAIGLLIRMYMGWEHYDPRLQRGVAFLAKEGPSTTDLYFDYYATQVLHHYGEPYWTPWNEKMRDYLVRTQAVTGHERGSWFFVDQHSVKAGRVYTTAMSAMILEVYYRHMPLYGNSVVDDGL